jgi:hypothetical protein
MKFALSRCSFFFGPRDASGVEKNARSICGSCKLPITIAFCPDGWLTPPSTFSSTPTMDYDLGGSHRFGEIFPANVWVTIFPFRTMKVSLPSSKMLSAVSALHRT